MNMIFDLPPLGGTAKPVFTAVAEYTLWLGDQTLTNPGNLQRVLFEQLSLVNQYAIPLRQRFEILETMHAQVVFVQEEAAKHFTGKPLPYVKREADAFAGAMDLWQAVIEGYLRCLEDADASGASPATLATLVQCVLSSLHQRQLDCARGFMQPEAAHWARLHQLLAFAEDRNIVATPTIDKARYGERKVTPLSVYVEAILLHAVSATEFSAQSLRRVVRWAHIWSDVVRLRLDPPPDLKVVPFNVDLASALPPTSLPVKHAGRPRFLDNTDLAASIKGCLAGLAAGRSPAQLELGEDCSAAACETLLQRLYQCWCRGGMQRPTGRQAASGTVELAIGAEKIWFQLAGSPFRQPRSADEQLLRREREELAAFGRVSGRIEAQSFDLNKFRTESGWQIVNESPNGMRLIHVMTAQSGRIGVGYLIAVKKPLSEHFVLASVRWLMRDQEGCLHAGVQFMVGAALPISFRISGINAAKEIWRPAFLLTDASLQQLVLPAVVFRVNRVLDVDGGSSLKQIKQLKLVKLLERSDDFERVQLE